MATPGILGGSAVTLKIGGTAIAHTTSASVSSSTETRNITTKDSGKNTEILPTRDSYEISCDGLVAEDAAYGYFELWTAKEAQTAVVALWGTHAAGDTSYTASAWITSLTWDNPDGDNSTFSATLMVTGAVTPGTFV